MAKIAQSKQWDDPVIASAQWREAIGRPSGNTWVKHRAIVGVPTNTDKLTPWEAIALWGLRNWSAFLAGAGLELHRLTLPQTPEECRGIFDPWLKGFDSTQSLSARIQAIAPVDDLALKYLILSITDSRRSRSREPSAADRDRLIVELIQWAILAPIEDLEALFQ